MNKEQIIELISKRISEHKAEIDSCQKNIQIIDKNRQLEDIKKLMILKDKMLFHKGCLLCLEDLLKEIE